MGVFSRITGSWSTPGTVPERAAAWGLTKRVYVEPFLNLSGIDVNDTGVAGYNLYPHQAWPNITEASILSTYPTTPASSIHVTGPNVLTAGNDPDGISGIGIFLASARDDGAGGYIGHAFKPPFYIQVVFPQNTPFGFWAIPIEFVTGQTVDFTEFDFWERITAGFTRHDWVGETQTHPATIVYDNFFPGYDLTSSSQNITTLGCGVIPSTMAGGTGIVELVLNGVHFTDAASAVLADTQTFFFYVGPGGNFGPIQVWQAP